MSDVNNEGEKPVVNNEASIGGLHAENFFSAVPEAMRAFESSTKATDFISGKTGTQDVWGKTEDSLTRAAAKQLNNEHPLTTRNMVTHIK